MPRSTLLKVRAGVRPNPELARAQPAAVAASSDLDAADSTETEENRGEERACREKDEQSPKVPRDDERP